MDDWGGLRTAAVVVAWLTVAGGLVLATTWFARGGGRTVGPEDEPLEDLGEQPGRGSPDRRRVTSFSVAQVAVHGILGLLTATLITYVAARQTDRPTGYILILVLIVVTALPGAMMFRKWLRNTRPAVSQAVARDDGRVEDRLPRAVVYGHGSVALATAALIVLLLIVD